MNNATLNGIPGRGLLRLIHDEAIPILAGAFVGDQAKYGSALWALIGENVTYEGEVEDSGQILRRTITDVLVNNPSEDVHKGTFTVFLSGGSFEP